MLTVALIGPDGTGKTTLGRHLEHTLPIPAKYLYMGFSADSSNKALPTTRLVYWVKRVLGRKRDAVSSTDLSKSEPNPQRLWSRKIAELRSSLRLINWLVEESYRYGLAYYYKRRGYIVLFDRHFLFDYYAYDTLNQRFHRFLLEHFYPKPDLVILLDAPATLLFARKGEMSIEKLEQLRNNYLQLGQTVKHFLTVDVTQSEEKTSSEIAEHILDFYNGKVGKRQ